MTKMKKVTITMFALSTIILICCGFYELGIQNGTKNGTNIGYEEGYKVGVNRVKQETEISFKDGFKEGFEQGVQKGKQEAKTVIPEGYIKLTDCVPLEDICAKFIDEYDYTCLIIGDYGKQLDNSNNASYEDVLKNIPDETEEYRNNMVNMSEVIDFETTETGLYLYMENGNKYYWRIK